MERRTRIAVAVAAPFLLADCPAGALTVDNGLAPPDPANVITAGEVSFSESVIVRDQGCAAEPIPCPSPGPATTVSVETAVSGGVVTYDSSTAIIDHVGQRSDFSQAYNDSQIEHAAGFVSGIRAHDQASILLTGGVLDGFDFVELLGSSSLQLQAGSTAGIRAQESSTVWMSGGLVFEFLSVRDDATAFISGGTTDASLSVSGNGVLTINGGDVFSQGLSVNGGIVRIVGSDFMVNGQPVGLGTVSVDFGGLEATLADGSYFASVFSRTNGGTIVLVPEPSTGLLLAGGLALLGRRRRAV